MTFLDTSVAGNLLVDGPGTQGSKELFASNQPLLGSSSMIAELLRLATRQDVDHRRAEALLARVQLLTVDDTVHREAGRLITPGTWILAAEAIHLVCALRLAQDEFLTYDRVQARGAGSLGMTVRSPGLEDRWWCS